VKQTTPKKVAIVGARFGNLAIEERMLGRLGVKLAEARAENQDEIVEIAQDAQVILCGGAPKITSSVIQKLAELRAVVRYGIGVDTVDLEECARRGIYVANVPDYCIEEVATHALALILTWARNCRSHKGAFRVGSGASLR
jgi:D-3-phosphoglycerate dehydrogenase